MEMLLKLVVEYGAPALGFYLAWLHNRAIKRMLNKKFHPHRQ